MDAYRLKLLLPPNEEQEKQRTIAKEESAGIDELIKAADALRDDIRTVAPVEVK